MAQDTAYSPENVYYESLDDKLTIYLYGITKLNQFQLKNAEKKDLIRYKPNERLNLGLGFNYRWLGIGAAFNFKFINRDDHIYGKTNSFDLQVDLFTSKMLFNANLQSYKGYYWNNVNDYYPDWNIRDSVIIRPDVSTNSLGANGIYIFNHRKFSFRSAFAYTERQKQSAGSWIAGGYFSMYGVNADSSLVPGLLHPSYPVYDSLTKLTSLNIGGAFGYSYTFVVRQKFFINSTLMIGISLQANEALDLYNNDLGSVAIPSVKSHFRLAVGFNNEKCFYGVSFVIDSYLVQNKSKSEFTYNQGKLRIFYGRRFSLGKS